MKNQNIMFTRSVPKIVEGPALQVGSGAGGSCIDHASLPAARPNLWSE